MSFWEFFQYYILSRVLVEAFWVGVVVAIFVAVVIGHWIHRRGSSIMGMVWGDRDLDGKRDDEQSG
jgi:hypothetical protein